MCERYSLVGRLRERDIQRLSDRYSEVGSLPERYSEVGRLRERYF